MQNITLGQAALKSSRLIYGCMRLVGDGSVADRQRGKQALRAAIDAGYTHFDHADIYGGGHCESLFAEVLTEAPALRERLLLTSKAGIRPHQQSQPMAPTRYDFSRQYLLDSVDGILSRLNTDYLDMFLLHRPDYLFAAEEVAETFSLLQQAGKVRHFGVSNFSCSQFSLLQSACSMPLLVNQLEINIHNINTLLDGTLDQCQQLGVTPIAWCPLGGVAYPAWGNTFSPQDEQRIATELARQSDYYQCQGWQVVLAWLLKHPAGICPIIGSTTPERIVAAKQALEFDYSREDWYRLLEARNGQPVP